MRDYIETQTIYYYFNFVQEPVLRWSDYAARPCHRLSRPGGVGPVVNLQPLHRFVRDHLVGASSPAVILCAVLAVFLLVYTVYILLAYTSLKRNVLPV